MDNAHSSPSIVLRSFANPMQVRGEDVYFAFPDGRLDYDCQSCGATCCKGHGYMLHSGRELTTQIQKRPAAMMFMETAPDRGRGAFQMKNSPPACFFLQTDHNCSIHLENGYGAKPETCRLFPFNHIRRVGSSLIIRPHPSLCPLSVTAKGMRSLRSSHHDLLASIAEFGLSAVVPPAFPRTTDTNALLALERSIAQQASDSLESHSYNQFAALQLELGGAGFAPGAAQSPTAALEQLFEGIGRILGSSPSAPSMAHEASVRTLIAATPALRAALLFPDTPANGRPAPRELGSDQITRMLSALSVMLGFAHEAGMADITIQTVHRIFSQNTELLLLLSVADQAVVWCGDAPIELPFDGPREWQLRYLGLARALLPAVQLSRRAPLFELVSANSFGDPLSNLSFVKQFARTVAGRLAQMSSPSSQPPRFSIKRAAQRWALQHAPIEALAQMAGRTKKGGTSAPDSSP